MKKYQRILVAIDIYSEYDHVLKGLCVPPEMQVN
jgi:hypothetical protein